MSASLRRGSASAAASAGKSCSAAWAVSPTAGAPGAALARRSGRAPSPYAVRGDSCSRTCFVRRPAVTRSSPASREAPTCPRGSVRRALTVRPGGRSCLSPSASPQPPPAAPTRPPPPPPAPTPSPPPSAPGGVPVRPPGASLVAGDTTVRLAYGSYCWVLGRPDDRVAAPCTDLTLPQDPRIPRVRVRPGQLLTLNLGFEPTSLAVLLGGPGITRGIETELRRELTFRIPDGFAPPSTALLVVVANGSAGGRGRRPGELPRLAERRGLTGTRADSGPRPPPQAGSSRRQAIRPTSACQWRAAEAKPESARVSVSACAVGQSAGVCRRLRQAARTPSRRSRATLRSSPPP